MKFNYNLINLIIYVKKFTKKKKMDILSSLQNLFFSFLGKEKKKEEKKKEEENKDFSLQEKALTTLISNGWAEPQQNFLLLNQDLKNDTRFLSALQKNTKI